MKNVQIIDNDVVKKADIKFSNLIEEVKAQDRYSVSSWYQLTAKAYEEWLEFCKKRD